jgi:uncharacterized membrane protein (Fun14 family)
MYMDILTSVSGTIGGGFLGGLLLGYAIKKIVKLIAVVVGLFIAGLAYLQYQQIASFDWNRIAGVVTTTLGNVTSQISSGQDGVAVIAMSNFGIPLTSSMSAGFAIGFLKG